MALPGDKVFQHDVAQSITQNHIYIYNCATLIPHPGMVYSSICKDWFRPYTDPFHVMTGTDWRQIAKKKLIRHVGVFQSILVQQLSAYLGSHPWETTGVHHVLKDCIMTSWIEAQTGWQSKAKIHPPMAGNVLLGLMASSSRMTTFTDQRWPTSGSEYSHLYLLVCCQTYYLWDSSAWSGSGSWRDITGTNRKLNINPVSIYPLHCHLRRKGELVARCLPLSIEQMQFTDHWFLPAYCT